MSYPSNIEIPEPDENLKVQILLKLQDRLFSQNTISDPLTVELLDYKYNDTIYTVLGGKFTEYLCDYRITDSGTTGQETIQIYEGTFNVGENYLKDTEA